MNEALKEKLQGKTLKTELLDLPDYGQVTIRELTARQGSEVLLLIANEKSRVDGMYLAALYGLGFEKSDAHLFENAFSLLATVAGEVMRLSGLDDSQKKI